MSRTAQRARILNGTYSEASAFPAVSVKAWRLTGNGPDYVGYPIDIPETEGDIAEQAMIYSAVNRGDCIAIMRTDNAERPERRNMIMIYAVKRRSSPRYVKGPDGTTIRAHDEYLYLVTQFYAADFAPVEPFRAGRDNAVGADMTLVEGAAT